MRLPLKSANHCVGEPLGVAGGVRVLQQDVLCDLRGLSRPFVLG